jgi:hypothetical protein
MHWITELLCNALALATAVLALLAAQPFKKKAEVV